MWDINSTGRHFETFYSLQGHKVWTTVTTEN
jgi:hypothetical protein